MTTRVSHTPVALIPTVLGLFLAAPAPADLVSIQAAHDNTLYQDATGSLSNGAGSFLFAGTTATGVLRRALISFDIAAAVPTGATINSVTLTLHLSQSAAGTLPVDVHRVLSAWGEGTSDAACTESTGAPATIGDATWVHTFFDSQVWSIPGGDFEALISATSSVGGIGFYNWSGAGLVSDVQDWLIQPTTNFGWILRSVESTPQTAKRFDSRQNETANFRPVLVVEFTPVPAPAGAVVALAVPLMRVRRRRTTG